MAVIHDCHTKEESSPIHISLDQMAKEYPQELRQKIFITHYEDLIERHFDKIEKLGFERAQQGHPIDL